MNVKEYILPLTNDIAKGYIQSDEKIASLFDYSLNDEMKFHKRKEDLEKRNFQRQELASVLEKAHKNYKYNTKALEQIERLKDENSLFVVGGQQPGVLTGPLYTIYKAITVIELAKEQESELGVPVIPLFWIAGEDHDFAEIHHIFIQSNSNNNWKKHAISDQSLNKKMLSYLEIEQKDVKQWLEKVFFSYKETAHTKELYNVALELLERSNTFVDFFAELMSWLFKEEGLLLLDSADKNVRQLEKTYFVKMIEQNQQIQEAFIEGVRQIESLGFTSPIELAVENGNLFYVENGKRHRIDREGEHFNTGKRTLSTDELLKIAKESPEYLSNNVVTRPLMQEELLPVLAFVGGPGEIAYWSTLKEVFHLFSYKIPPLIPRIAATIVDRQTEKWLEEYQVSAEEALQGVSQEKNKWYEKQKKWNVEETAILVKEKISAVHREFQDLATAIDPSLEKIALKNYQIIEGQLTYLEKKLEGQIRKQYEVELSHFDLIEMSFSPDGKPQERFFNIFYYLNQYGSDLVPRISSLQLKRNYLHKVIYL
ncbi:bacillithiol biosynthesis cysteine-adding enzyme BshC [Bacillus sp. FJAT-45350]|uniref:bacillithiol biosynthesis cysteine-adding enzyme BshC n=1 Tax=Bacillus sp. FJAT-45350 TaxID=2011014 RepID=UPI0015C7F6C5|nr:bacillithiol biosynthesis cysteine-adding enzyme BshC [Bacillus sp. FJAT-45350]